MRSAILNQCVMAVQGHPRSLILIAIESMRGTSYLSATAILALSCPI